MIFETTLISNQCICSSSWSARGLHPFIASLTAAQSPRTCISAHTAGQQLTTVTTHSINTDRTLITATAVLAARTQPIAESSHHTPDSYGRRACQLFSKSAHTHRVHAPATQRHWHLPGRPEAGERARRTRKPTLLAVDAAVQQRRPMKYRNTRRAFARLLHPFNSSRAERCAAWYL